MQVELTARYNPCYEKAQLLCNELDKLMKRPPRLLKLESAMALAAACALIVNPSPAFSQSLEARIDAILLGSTQIKVVTFFDAGDVRDTRQDIQLAKLHWATGLGIRYATPVGQLRLDVGYRLNRVDFGEPAAGQRLAYHLSLGEAF